MRLFNKSPEVPPEIGPSPTETALHSLLMEFQSLKERLDAPRDTEIRPEGRAWTEVQELLFQKLQYPLMRDLILFYDRVAKSVGDFDQAAREDILETVRSYPEELVDLLREHGVEPLAAGERLDPELHQATRVVETGDPEQHQRIARVVRTGFRIHGRVLRKAEVEVYRLASGGRS